MCFDNECHPLKQKCDIIEPLVCCCMFNITAQIGGGILVTCRDPLFFHIRTQKRESQLNLWHVIGIIYLVTQFGQRGYPDWQRRYSFKGNIPGKAW